MPKFLLFLLLFPSTLFAALTQPVLTGNGLLQGAVSDNGNMAIFRGVPYAAAPVGINRWREPQPAITWSGTRMATEFAARCVQGGFAPGASQPLSSEDCLFLNIWTPADTAEAGLPVMIWIHGGGFFGGAGSAETYDGAELAAQGAVVITLNYRLGVFGFFAHPELSAESPNGSSGNYALLDMVAALQWIKANIAAFGGATDNITIMGESAGAQSVAALLLSPLADGLFERAILQSAGWMGWAGFEAGGQVTLAAREALGAEQLTAFGAGSIAELRQADTQAVFAGLPGGGSINVDGYLLPQDSSLLLTGNRTSNVDVLVGSNRDEAVFFGPGIREAAAFKTYVQNKYAALAADYLRLYPAGNDAQANASYLKAWSDETAWQMRKIAGVQSAKGNQGWVYYFTHVPPGQEARGATHVAELHYMFNHVSQSPTWREADIALAKTMSAYWVNFARTGNPNGPGLPAWPAYHAADPISVLELGDVVAAQKASVPEPAALLLFDAAFETLVEKLQP